MAVESHYCVTIKDIIEKHIADEIRIYRENNPNDNKTDEELRPYAYTRLLDKDWEDDEEYAMIATEQVKLIKSDFDAFKSSIKNTVEHYIKGFQKSGQYDGQDNYLGENVYLKMASGTFYGQTLAEVLEEIFGEIGIK